MGELERRARDMFEIEESKSIIATCSGTTAIHAILYAIFREHDRNLRVGTQDFNFASNSTGPAEGPILCDILPDTQANLDDEYIQANAELVIVTNCFGHLQDLDQTIEKTEGRNKILILDNATVPYTFYKGRNSLNYGTASYLSLHTTKLIGMGEGGLVIIDKEYEEAVRRACNYGKVGEQFNERSGNFKMSEFSAAGILQYWDQFDFSELRKESLITTMTYDICSETKMEIFGLIMETKTTFFLHGVLLYTATLKNQNTLSITASPAKKYYHPLRGFPITKEIYDRIMCYSVAKDFDKCLKK